MSVPKLRNTVHCRQSVWTHPRLNMYVNFCWSNLDKATKSALKITSKYFSCWQRPGNVSNPSRVDKSTSREGPKLAIFPCTTNLTEVNRRNDYLESVVSVAKRRVVIKGIGYYWHLHKAMPNRFCGRMLLLMSCWPTNRLSTARNT